MISRSFTASSNSTSIEYSGMIGLLKPIKRTKSQINDETCLLRRFTYKNKNQHKGTNWWKKIIESDRILSRVLEELEGFLVELEGNQGNGIIRFTRCSLILDKAIEVLVNSATVLDLLILSRAFLPFSVTVVALISRLYVLTTILFEDLQKVSTTLIRLVTGNKESIALQAQIYKLPKKLQQFLPNPLDSAVPTNSITPLIIKACQINRSPSPQDSVTEVEFKVEVLPKLTERKRKVDKLEGKVKKKHRKGSKNGNGVEVDEIDDIFAK